MIMIRSKSKRPNLSNGSRDKKTIAHWRQLDMVQISPMTVHMDEPNLHEIAVKAECDEAITYGLVTAPIFMASEPHG